ncbi:MAG: hypothetical protein ACFFG0_29525 [Candidatus Thorarchaeota archaeon]
MTIDKKSKKNYEVKYKPKQKKEYKERKENEKRTECIKIYVTNSEKNKIKQHAKDSKPKKTCSEFTRIALFDKIRNIEHPAVSFIPDQFNSKILEELVENRNKMNMVLEKTNEFSNLYIELEKTRDLIYQYSTKNFKEEKDTIDKLLVAFGELSAEEIKQKTDYIERVIFQIITNKEDYNYNLQTRRFSKK